MTLPTSRKRCSGDSNVAELFFSLIDYRNNLFTSNDPQDIINFYDSFRSRDDLIEWMKERPKGATYIHEAEGNKDIVVVIPTADFNGKYARECRENIFKGLHIIFVESGEIPDPYFNYAHNCNVGIKKALEYKPKWIVLSNDDMYKIDGTDSLISTLNEISPEDIDCVFTDQGRYHSTNGYIGKPRVWFWLMLKFMPGYFKGFGRVSRNLTGGKYTPVKNHSLLHRIFYKKIRDVTLILDFGIFSSKFLIINGGTVFDETYVNGGEDSDLSLRIEHNGRKGFINYRIGDLVGSTIGVGISRWLRNVCAEAYFSYKIENGSLKL